MLRKSNIGNELGVLAVEKHFGEPDSIGKPRDMGQQLHNGKVCPELASALSIAQLVHY